MNRLFMANGTWQLTILAGAVRTAGISVDPERCRVALFGEGLTPMLREAMNRFAETLFPRVPVLWWDELLAFPEAFRQPFADRQAELRCALAGFAPREVWTSKLFTSPEKFVLACFPKAGVQVYEEGLHSFVQKAFTPGGQLADLLRPRVVYRGLRQARTGPRGPWWAIAAPGVASQQAARVEGAWYLLHRIAGTPDYIPLQAVRGIDPRCMREVIAALPSPGHPVEAVEDGRPSFLVLGQCFSRWDQVSWDDECAFYRDRIATIVAKGYRILWKDHPRADPPFGPWLQAHFGAETFAIVDLPQAWPVEIVAPRMGLAGCATVSSSALFYLRLLYDIPTYTLADDAHLAQIGYKDFAAIADLSRKTTPPLDALPEASV